MSANTTTHLITGDIIRYKRDGKFRVLAHVDGDRWSVEGLGGKFAGRTRTVTLDADTPVLEAAPRPVVEEAPAAPAVEVPAPAAPKAPRKARAPRAAAPAREALPDGWVTPYGLADIINERGLYHGSRAAMPGKGVYARALRAPKSNPFPGQEVGGRLAVEIEAGIAWWKRAHRAANA